MRGSSPEAVNDPSLVGGARTCIGWEAEALTGDMGVFRVKSHVSSTSGKPWNVCLMPISDLRLRWVKDLCGS